MIVCASRVAGCDLPPRSDPVPLSVCGMDPNTDTHKVVENGNGTGEETVPDQPAPDLSILLKKLEDQNRILQQDNRCHTHIVTRSGSTASLQDSIHSTDSSGVAAAANEERTSQTSHQPQEMTSPQPEPEERQESPVGRHSNKKRFRSDSEVGKMTADSLSYKKIYAVTPTGEEATSKGRERNQSLLSKTSLSPVSVDSLDATTQSMATTEGSVEGQELGSEEELWHKWSLLLKNWEESERKNQKTIRQLAQQGIPAHLRGMAWQLMSGAHDSELKDQYPTLITEMSPFERQIQRDLARTFPEHPFFKARDGLGQESLLNVMKAYSVYDREVGYCQGSPFITGMLLMQQMPEEEAFCVLVKLMQSYKLRELFKPSMADLSLCFYQLEKLVEELYPHLHLHFQAVGFQTSMYASAWFLTMFASVLSLNVAFRVMDIFLIEGKDIIFKVGLALLDHSESKLIQLDLEDMLKHFQKEMRGIHEADPDALIQKALKIKYNPKKLKKLEKEYLYRKEKQAMENAELIRLQAENTELTQRINALEKECASLADRLIQGQVTRAQEAEEMFIIKKELSRMKRRVSAFEEEQTKEGLENNVVEVNGTILEEEEEKGEGGGEGTDLTHSRDEEEDEMVEQQQLVVTAPTHVCREEAEQVLRELGVRTPGTSPRVSTQDPLKSSPPLKPSPPLTLKLAKRNSVPDFPQSSPSSVLKRTSLPDSSQSLPPLSLKQEKKERRKHKNSTDSKSSSSNSHRSSLSDHEVDSLTRELALAKTQCAELSGQVEQKKMEVKQVLQREALAVRELHSAKRYIATLEQRLSEVQMEKLQCPHCSQQLGQRDRSYTSPADPNSSEVLFSHLRAMWNSQAATNGDPGTGVRRFSRHGGNWT